MADYCRGEAFAQETRSIIAVSVILMPINRNHCANASPLLCIDEGDEMRVGAEGFQRIRADERIGRRRYSLIRFGSAEEISSASPTRAMKRGSERMVSRTTCLS